MSEYKADSEPAFPCERTEYGDQYRYEGMTLRDYFAAAAMEGYCTRPDMECPDETIAAYAYDIADAMLKARGES